MDTIDIKRIDRETVSDQIRVYMDAFDHPACEYNRIEAGWKIKHYGNPHGESYVFGAYSGNTLVGMNSFMPLRYRYMGKNVEVVQSCESGVLKSHRRRGIWQRVMTYAENYLKENSSVEAIIGFPNYGNSYSGFLKMGYETLYFERNMLMVCNGRMLMESMIGRHWWNGIAKFTELQKSFSSILHCIGGGYRVTEVQDGKMPLFRKDTVVLPVTGEIVEWKRYKSLRVFDVLWKETVVARFYGYEETRNGIKYFMLSRCYKLDRNVNERYSYAAMVNHLSRMQYAVIRLWSNGLCGVPAIGFIEMKSHKNPFIIKLLKDSSDYLLNPLIWDVGILDLD